MMILILIASSCNTQSEDIQNNIDKEMDTSLSFIDNRSIKYDFGRVLCDTTFPFTSYPNWSTSVFLTDEQNEIVRKLDKQTWLNLLNSPHSDFAANLILYSIYNKDAFLFVFEKNLCESWKKYNKEEDLDYWKKHLDSVICGAKCQNHEWQ